MPRTALVIGGSGVIGQRLSQHLASTGTWKVVEVTRRERAAAGGRRQVAIDLTDAIECRRRAAEFGDVTHVFYAARFDQTSAQGVQEPIGPNLDMFRNTLDAVERSGAALQHVHLVQGTKYYGANMGPFRTPAREDDPRGTVENFYFPQQDHLSARQRGRSWTWSVSRPAGVCDVQADTPRSIVRVLGVYASLLRAEGSPLHFPGTERGFEILYQFVDAGLLARAMEFCATDGRCANEAFNVTNGDVFRWRNLWPRIASLFDMEAGDVVPMKLAAAMSSKAAAWAELRARHGLRAVPFDDIARWPFGDYVLGSSYDVISSTTKLRGRGFAEFRDTEDMLLAMLARSRSDRVIP